MSRSWPRIWHSHLPNYGTVTDNNGPVKGKALQATEDIAFIVVANNSDHLIFIHTELSISSVNIETHYGADFNLAA